MKEMPLTQGKVALVDDEDYEWLNKWKWSASKDKDNWYAHRLAYPLKGHIKMHRVVIDAPDGVDVDHKDGNGLNNQKKNLRLCTNRQNAQNRKVRRDSSTGYKGVGFRPETQRYRVTIQVEGKRINVGQFDSLVEAAYAYDSAARKYFGEFARTNF